MPSLTAKDRISLCLFSYEDGRRCRTPRISSHPHFCFYHAQKESQSQAAEKLANDLSYFFSGDYISANDLSTALSRLIPAAVRGQIKPRLARTLAYMFQIQLQAIHLSQREYVNAFGTDGWRKALRSSVTSNADYLYPPNAAPAESNAVPTPTPSPTQAALNIARNLFPERPNDVGSAFRGGPHIQPEPPAAAIVTAVPTLNPAHHAVQSPATAPTTNPATPTQTRPPQPTNPTPPPSLTSRRQPGAPTRDPYAVHFDHNYRLYVDGKPW